MNVGDGRGWYVRGVIRDNLTGEVREAMNIPAPDKEHLVSEEYLQACEEADWDELHVLPADDSAEHRLDQYCGCGLDMEFHAATLFLHQAHDGREALEWVQKIFNQQS